MAYVTVDCRKTDENIQIIELARGRAVHRLTSESIGSVAAVWSGNEQTHRFKVVRLAKMPVIIEQQIWPVLSTWNLASTRGLTFIDAQAVRKALVTFNQRNA